MELTTKQAQGLDIAIQRYRNNEKFTVISGYAGSGKSTLVKFIIDALTEFGIDPEEDVCFSCFTGKACQVLQKKGNKNVYTLHKLLYEHVPKPEGGFIRKTKPFIDYKIVVVDEVSMAPASLMKQLFSHDVHVICLGDPFQLPPVDKNDAHGLLDNPHIFLDEIMRQAQESEIIRATMDIRNYKPISITNGNEVKIYSYNDYTTGMMEWADQILCGTNNNRVAVNNQMRDLLGRGKKPEDGDKIICLKNNWDILSENHFELMNGTIGYIKNSYPTYFTVPSWCGPEGTINILHCDFETDTGEIYHNLDLDLNQILTGNPTLSWKTKYKMSRSKKINIDILDFAYGYGITCWKAQGSEWDKVLVLEEKFPFDREEHQRFLYTALTRASKKVVLIR